MLKLTQKIYLHNTLLGHYFLDVESNWMLTKDKLGQILLFWILGAFV